EAARNLAESDESSGRSHNMLVIEHVGLAATRRRDVRSRCVARTRADNGPGLTIPHACGLAGSP
ncbi:MAG TPA: hypothetical protein VNU19_03880, partial [Candidatus Acidoferrum sp.]|nr:hypothetical protein [Candidatus Acidoferrum sp.]